MMNFLFAQATALEITLMLAFSFAAINRTYSVMGKVLGLPSGATNLIKLGLMAAAVLMVSFFDGFSSTLMVIATAVTAVPVLMVPASQLEKLALWSISPEKPFNQAYNAVMTAFFLFAVIGEYLVNDTVAVVMLFSVLGSAVGVALGVYNVRLQRKLAA